MATQPTRPYDALYDPTFTVAGARDHYRQQTLGGGFNIERAPIYNNFFSELPHHPSSTLRLKNGDRVPAFIDRNYHQSRPDPVDLQQRSDALAVSGGERPKYFRRPLLAAAEIHVKQSPLPPLPQYQDLNATAPAAMGAGGPEPRSKTIGTQSDYRENEAQTAPWEPGYVLPEHPTAKQQALSKRYHTDGPEVLHLRDMAFADGLPAGLQEVTRIDKMRAKRAFEATLPPIDDVARLPLRQKMIEEWEAREWEEREQEILDIQERRLGLLENALQVREEEMDEDHRSRVEERKKATLAARAGRFADVQATRIKTMRQLIENRKYVEKHRKLHKPTIVERYANFGSGTYAPLQREGRFPESKPMGQEIETEGYEPATLKGVLELESFLPSRLLNPKVAAPKRPDRLDYGQRKEAAVQRDLKTINDLLDVSKATAGRGHGDCWPAPLKEDSLGGLAHSSSLKRASSSSLSKSGQTGGVPASAGGLGSTGPLASAPGSGATAVGAPADAKEAAAAAAGTSPTRRVMRTVERPATPELPVPPALSQPQHAALVLLQRLLRGRAAQNIMYEGRVRRQELIDELRVAERLNVEATRLDGKPIRRPEERDAATVRVDALLGSTVAEVMVALAETDPSKREVLMAALDSSRAHAAAAAFAAAASELSAAAAAAVAEAAAGLAAAAARSSQTEVPPQAAPQAAAAPPTLAQQALNLEALGISREEAEAAATRIQAAFHGHKARKEVAAMRARGALLRQIMANGDEGKVVKCQAAVRGYLGRKRVAAMRRAKEAADAGTVAGAEDGAEGADEAAAAAGVEAEAATEAEAESSLPAPEQQQQADFDPTTYSDEHVAAVTRIQAAQRGRMARKRVAAIRAGQAADGGEGDAVEGEQAAAAAAADADAETGAVAPPAEPEPEAEAAEPSAAPPADVHSDYTVEQEVAVIKIQAAGRGYLARRRVAAMRAAEQGGSEGSGPGPDLGGQRRTTVIGRQGDPELYAAAAAAAAAPDTAGGDGGAAADADGDMLWPKMGNLSGFVLRPAAPAGEAAQLPEAPEAEESQAAAAAPPPPPPPAVMEAEPEASLAFAGAQEPSATEGLAVEGEPSLAVGSGDDDGGGGGGEATEAGEPAPEASTRDDDGATEEPSAAAPDAAEATGEPGGEESEGREGEGDGEGEGEGAVGEASQAAQEGYEEGGGEESQAGVAEGEEEPLAAEDDGGDDGEEGAAGEAPGEAAGEASEAPAEGEEGAAEGEPQDE